VTLYSDSHLVELVFAVSKCALDSTHHRWRYVFFAAAVGGVCPRDVLRPCEVSLAYLLCDTGRMYE